GHSPTTIQHPVSACYADSLFASHPVLLLECDGALRDRHSFPTRRSSDLLKCLRLPSVMRDMKSAFLSICFLPVVVWIAPLPNSVFTTRFGRVPARSILSLS